MRLKFFGSIIALSLLSTHLSVANEKTGTELLFDKGSMAGIELGDAINYTHHRSSDENIPSRGVEDGEVIVLLAEEDDSRYSEVTLVNGKHRRKLHRFPADSGNPIFVTFLESSVSAVAFATKGSSFYIRNRIKDSFATGGEVSKIETEIDGKAHPATQIIFRPFKGDPNAAKMGKAFEALTMSFVMSDDVPGKFTALITEAKVDGTQYFVEEIRFIDAKPSSK